MPKRILPLAVVLALVVVAFIFYFAATRPPLIPQRQLTSPVNELALHLVGVHVIKESPERQYPAHHYCKQVREGFIQCAVFDSAKPGARLIDVEYVVSDEIYRSFTPEEQQYWHPHDYEVDQGLLQAPELPSDQARALLSTIRSTHGKTWHLWAAKENPLPLGKPELSWSITGPGQLRADVEKDLRQ